MLWALLRVMRKLSNATCMFATHAGGSHQRWHCDVRNAFAKQLLLLSVDLSALWHASKCARSLSVCLVGHLASLHHLVASVMSSQHWLATLICIESPISKRTPRPPG